MSPLSVLPYEGLVSITSLRCSTEVESNVKLEKRRCFKRIYRSEVKPVASIFEKVRLEALTRNVFLKDRSEAGLLQVRMCRNFETSHFRRQIFFARALTLAF